MENKPRFIAITAEEFQVFIGSLDAPTMYKSGGTWYVNAAEYREWSASQSTSFVEPK
jgi:hypothetical protein